jgi:hypothetical protein
VMPAITTATQGDLLTDEQALEVLQLLLLLRCCCCLMP